MIPGIDDVCGRQCAQRWCNGWKDTEQRAAADKRTLSLNEIRPRVSALSARWIDLDVLPEQLPTMSAAADDSRRKPRYYSDLNTFDEEALDELMRVCGTLLSVTYAHV